MRQLRLVVEADDYDEAVAFYRDVLGLREEAVIESEGGASVTILDAGRATLELVNPAQRRLIDRVEVGHPTESRIRVAFEVLDAEERTTALVEQGAELVAPPTETPWRSLNSRLDAPAGLHITLFQELDERLISPISPRRGPARRGRRPLRRHPRRRRTPRRCHRTSRPGS